MAATGHTLQVEDDPIAAPLFVVHGRERRRVLWDGPDRYLLRGAGDGARPVADLLATIADNPAVVSPGVLLRPVVQDAVLGTALQLMGPGELAYLVQAAPLYAKLEVAAPRVALRPQMLVLDRKQRGHLDGLGLTLDQLLLDERSVFALLDRGGASDAHRVAARGHARRARCDEERVHGARRRARAPVREDARADRSRARAVRVQGERRRRAPRPDRARAHRVAARAPVCPAARRRSGFSRPRTSRCATASGSAAAVMAQLDVESDAVQIIDPEAAP